MHVVCGRHLLDCDRCHIESVHALCGGQLLSGGCTRMYVVCRWLRRSPGVDCMLVMRIRYIHGCGRCYFEYLSRGRRWVLSVQDGYNINPSYDW